MMYGAPRPPIELPSTSALRNRIASFGPHRHPVDFPVPGPEHGPVDQPVPIGGHVPVDRGPVPPSHVPVDQPVSIGGGPFSGFGPGGPVRIMQPMQQGNQQAMLGAMRGYLQ